MPIARLTPEQMLLAFTAYLDETPAYEALIDATGTGDGGDTPERLTVSSTAGTSSDGGATKLNRKNGDQEQSQTKEQTARDFDLSKLGSIGSKLDKDATDDKKPGGLAEKLNAHPAVVKARATAKDHGPSGDGTRYPIHLPIIPDSRFRGVLGALASSLGTSKSIDTQATVRRFARTGRRLGLIYRKRRTIRGGIVLVIDETDGMIPFFPDMLRFRNLSRGILGKERVHLARFKADGQFEAPKRWPRGGAVIVLTDLHAFAKREGRPHPGHGVWQTIIKAAQAMDMSVSALVPARPAPHLSVPQAAFPEFFAGRLRDIAVVPWFDTLDRRIAAIYSAMSQKVRFEPRKDQLRPVSRALRDLLSIVSDVELYTLRTLRKVLSDPKSVADAYDLDLKHDADLSLKGKLGPWHEHRIWTENLFAARGAISRFDRPVMPLDYAPLRGARGQLARDVMSESRAIRGVEQVVGDEYQWLLTQSPSKETTAARNTNVALAHSVAEERGPQLLRRIWGRDVTNDRVKADEKFTVRIQNNELTIGLDDPAANVAFKLNGPANLSEATLELWRARAPKNAEDGPKDCEMVESWDLNALPMTISLDDIQPETGVIRLGGRTFPFSLAQAGSTVEALFTRGGVADTSGQDLRFDSGALVFGGQRFDPVGLRPLGDAAPVVETRAHNRPRKAEDGWHPARPAVSREKESRLLAQRDAGSLALSTIVIPMDSSRWNYNQGWSGPGGTAVTAPDEVWVMTDVGQEDKVAIQKWRALDETKHPFVLDTPGRYAVSSAGLVLHRTHEIDGKSLIKDNDLVIFPPATSEVREPIIVPFPHPWRNAALSEDGWLAVDEGGTLTVYLISPERVLDSSDLQSFQTAATHQKPLETRFKREISTTRRWHPEKSFPKREMADALSAGSVRNLSRYNDIVLEAETVTASEFTQAPLGLSDAASSALAAIVNRDPANLRARLEAEPGLIGMSFGEGDWSLAHVAAATPDGSECVRALLNAGAAADAEDAFGRTPLYFAAWSMDGGASLEALLDCGANPDHTTTINGETCGPLADSLSSTKSMTKPVARNIIDRMLDKGARADVFNSTADRTALFYATSREDEELFDIVFSQIQDRLENAEDPDTVRDIIDAQDRLGWTALTVAMWRRLSQAIDRLLDHNASPFLGPSGSDAFELCVHFDHDRVFDRLANFYSDDARLGQSLRRAATELDLIVNRNARWEEDGAWEKRVAPLARILARLLSFEAVGSQMVWASAAQFSTNAAANKRLFMLVDAAQVELNPIATIMALDARYAAALKALLQPDRRALIDWSSVGTGGVTMAHLLAAFYEFGEDPDADQFVSSFLEDQAAEPVADESGFTALHYACAFENEEMVRHLLSRQSLLSDVVSGDGRLPGDMNQKMSAMLPELKRTSPVGPQPAPPKRSEQLSLTSLTPDEPWQGETVADRLLYSDQRAPKVPLAAISGAWRPTAQRTSAALPYDTPTFLRETWMVRETQRGVLIEIVDDTGELVFQADGRSSPIHQINEQRKISLTTDRDAVRYLIFFCACVHGEDGPFTIVPEIDTARAIGADAVPDVDWESGVKIKTTTDTYWDLEAVVFYNNSLVSAEFQVEKAGPIKMLSDEPIAEGIGLSFRRDGNIFFRTARPT